MIINQPNIHGINIYRDRKGYVVYYNRFADRAYRITEEDKPKYEVLSNRLAISLLSAVVIYAFSNKVFISIAVSVLLYILLSVCFYLVFLPSLPESVGFQLTQKNKPFGHFLKTRTRTQFIVAVIALIAAEIIICILMNQGSMADSKRMYQILSLLTLGGICFFIWCISQKMN